MINILYVLPSIGFGGAELQSIWQINWLHQQGYLVHLLVLNHIVCTPQALLIPAHCITQLHYPDSTITKSAIINSYKLIVPITKYLKEKKFSHIVAHLPLSHWVMRWATLNYRLQGGKVQLINYHHSLFKDGITHYGITEHLFDNCQTLLARLTDNANICVSKSVQNSLVKKTYLPASLTIYNGILYKSATDDLAKQYAQQHQLPPNAFVVVLPGRLQLAKGHAFFLNVWQQFITVNQFLPNQVVLIIAGGGDEEQSLQNQLAKLNLQRYVHITNFVDHNLLLSFFCWAKLVVIPSLSEGFGNVAVEALMQKSLILASNAGGLSEIIEQNRNGFVFETANETDCLTQLNHIYQNYSPNLLNRDSLLVDYKTRFTLEIQMQKIVTLLLK